MLIRFSNSKRKTLVILSEMFFRNSSYWRLKEVLHLISPENVLFIQPSKSLNKSLKRLEEDESGRVFSRLSKHEKFEGPLEWSISTSRVLFVGFVAVTE